MTASLAWVLPAAAVAFWCVWHARATSEPLQFLRLNREFVSGYLGGVGYLWGQEPILPLMVVLYAVIVPCWNMLGAVHALAFVGIGRALRELPRELLAVGLALLAIVTIGLVRRSHLGLARHAVAIAPLFCALVAVGAAVLADRLGRSIVGLAGPRGREIVGLAVLGIVLGVRTVPEGVGLFRATARAFAAEAAAARALVRVARPGEPVFCDDGKIEVMSELSPERFVRWQIVDVAPFHVADLSRKKGSVLVVAAAGRAGHLAGGVIVWEGAGLAISRHERAP